MLEKVAKNELPDDVPDELSNLLIDRDTCKRESEMGGGGVGAGWGDICGKRQRRVCCLELVKPNSCAGGVHAIAGVCSPVGCVLCAGMNIVVGSHDIHVGKLLGREDETRAAEARAMSDIIDNRQREER